MISVQHAFKDKEFGRPSFTSTFWMALQGVLHVPENLEMASVAFAAISTQQTFAHLNNASGRGVRSLLPVTTILRVLPS